MRILSIALVIGAGLLSALPARAAAPVPVSDAPFAVVELFTSQGCSSCPPADRLLRELSSESRQRGRRVFALSLHVDYWNRLGWRDPFSDADYSNRQRRYGQARNARQIYTPQMIVNGDRSFIGSRSGTANHEIDTALRRTPAVATGVRAEYARDANKVVVDWALGEVPAGTTVVLALTQDGLSNDVPRGENRGRTLAHDGVVRVFTTVAAERSGRTTLAAPADFDPKQSAVVLLVQKKASMKIVGAAQARL